MADQDGAQGGSLVEDLLAAPHAYQLFQAIRLIEADEAPGARLVRTGEQAGARIRLRPSLSLGFSPADLDEAEVFTDGAYPCYRLTVNFLGLYGGKSPLPAFFTEDLMGDEEEDTARAFLDVFHHQLFTLFYSSQIKYRYFLQYRPEASDDFSDRIFSLIGLKHAASRGAFAVSRPHRLLGLLNVLALRGRSPQAIAQVISVYFGGPPVEVEEFVERRARIEPAQRARLGRMNSTLGLDAVIGETVADIAGKFRIVLGPLSFDDFESFQEGGARYADLHKLVRLAAPAGLAYEVELRLKPEAAPPLALTADARARLGRSSWAHPAPRAGVSVRLAPPPLNALSPRPNP
ncbi:MAG: type VI secretion system baseplate subunit TssG [Pseudomonadota bacterium]